MSLNFNQIRLLTAELPALESLKKSMYIVVNTLVLSLVPSFLFASSSFLQVTRTTKQSRMSSKFSQIGPWTAELAALSVLKSNASFFSQMLLI